MEAALRHAGEGGGVIIRRNCSCTPGRLMALFGLAALAPVCAASGLAFAGAWPVLPFAGLELALLAWAFCMQARHAADSERISQDSRRLIVEVRKARGISRHEFNPAWTLVKESTKDGSYRLVLCAHGAELEVGRHWDGGRRRELPAVLRQWLGTLNTSS